MNEKCKIVFCPTCGKEVEWRPESAWRPFCSQRCKLIDLGEWADEKYRIPSGLEQDPAPDGEA